MIRRPQRPIARVIAARERGENPDLHEAHARLTAALSRRAREHARARLRIGMLCLLFLLGFGAVGFRMVTIATDTSQGGRIAGLGDKFTSKRGEIVDRNGRVLATNVAARSLYVETRHVLNPVGTATQLATIFPDISAVEWAKKLSKPNAFYWVKGRVTPEQAQAAFDIGDPGVKLGKREVRVYPNGQLAPHVLGFAGFGEESVDAAQVVGRAGVELWFDRHLRGGKDAEPQNLRLSIDTTLQFAIRNVLQTGMSLMNAKAATATLMDVHTGEVLALVSLPDFDPNRPPPKPDGVADEDTILFNHAAQGTYELGSTFKVFAAATAIEAGIATPDTLIDTKEMRWNEYTIKEYGGSRSIAPFLSLTNVLVRSSNIGTARLALEFGPVAQKTLFDELGLLDPAPLELPASKITKPLYPKKWSEISTITTSYGHGISSTPVHLAAAYASLLNGGIKVEPTLVANGNAGKERVRIISEATSGSLRYMLRKVVTEGTASMANIAGYEVAGKTGTAEKAKRDAPGYHTDKVMANFAGVFPASNPKYVLVVTSDEPQDTVAGKPKRSAGWTAAPIAGQIIRRIGPLLDLPVVASNGQATGTATTMPVSLASQ